MGFPPGHAVLQVKVSIKFTLLYPLCLLLAGDLTLNIPISLLSNKYKELDKVYICLSIISIALHQRIKMLTLPVIKAVFLI